MGVPPNGWFIREDHSEMDDLGVPLIISGTPISWNIPLLIGAEMRYTKEFKLTIVASHNRNTYQTVQSGGITGFFMAHIN